MTTRYARQELIPGWEQERVSQATVIVVGMGALGNEVSRVLAMAGVGRLIICDPDRVEVSNLSRTSLFCESDVGASKVAAAAAALARLSPRIAIDARARPLVSGIGLAELRDAQLVIGCLDSDWARLQLAGRCNLVRARSLDGGTHAWGGEVRPYLDPDGPCYGCSLTPAARAAADVPASCRPSLADAPAAAGAHASALVGAWTATLALRVLLGLTGPTGVVRIDGPAGKASVVTLGRDPECPLHDPLGATEKVDVASGDPIDALRACLASGEVPLAWTPVIRRVECPRCAFHDVPWATTEMRVCPQCGYGLRVQTTLELSEVPDRVTLDRLGLAPRDVLGVRGRDGLRWIELRG